MAMEVTNSGDETKMTENTIMHEEAQAKLGGSGTDSRDRRKSKYLSYPYTNLRSNRKDLPAETEKLKTPCPPQKAGASSVATTTLNLSSSYAKLSSKRFRKNWYRKFISCNNLSCSPQFMDVSAVDLLSGLSSTAVDCMFPVWNKSFDLVEQFFCRHRISNYHDEAELATSQVNAQEEELGKHLGNDLADTKSKKRKNNKMENAVRRKKKSLSGLSNTNANTSSIDSQMPVKKLKQKRKMEEATSVHQPQNVDTNLIGGSSKYSSIPQNSPNLSCLSEGKAVHKKRKKIEAQEYQSAQISSVYTNGKKHKCSSLVIDLQFKSPPIPVDIPERNKSGNKEELVFKSTNPESFVSQERPVGRITDNSLLVSAKAEADTVLVNKTASKNSMGKAAGRHLNTKLAVEQTGLNNSMEKAAEKSVNPTLALEETGLKNSTEMVAEKPLNTKYVVEIPDLNGTGGECNSITTEFDTVNFLSAELKPEQSRSFSACSRPIKTTDSGEPLGNCLLLLFAPVAYMPSKQDLMTTFCRFGPLKPTETQLLKDTGSAQVVFVRSKDAAAAFHSLEQDKFAFGSTLVDFKLHHHSAPCPPVEKLKISAQPTGFMPMPGVTPTQPTGSAALPCVTPVQLTGSMAVPMTSTQQTGSTVPMPDEKSPSLQFMKQNLQMMASVLENSGGSLSPQTRDKLDSEIKNLMRKVNSRIKV